MPEPATSLTAKRLWGVTGAFQRWLYLPDPSPLHIALATVVANRMDGDPVWLLLVGPPGSAKTEILNTLAPFPDVFPSATFTEAALLSGTPARDRAKAARGGLLRELGDAGIVLCKDFGSVLSMGSDERARVMAAFREIYDGAWTRRIGAEGGRALEWKGKAGFLGGATPVIDQHHSVMGALGERFIFFRMPWLDRDEQASAAISVGARAHAMREELAQSVLDFLSSVTVPNGNRYLDPGEQIQLVALANLATRCRSEVVRDRWSRDIDMIPDTELPARLAKVLAQMFEALLAIGVERDPAWRLVTKLAVDSGPRDRWRVLRVLLQAREKLMVGDVGESVGLPSSTTRRLLEDLTAHGLLGRVDQGQGRAALWHASETACGLAEAAALDWPEATDA